MKRKGNENANNQNKFDAFNEVSQVGLFEKSISSTFKDLQRKLDQINSPSDSKSSASEQESNTSIIPPAHREYEKMLRQLEAECRNHIRCEQQMKLHMECL
jgi:hypothetical protein